MQHRQELPPPSRPGLSLVVLCAQQVITASDIVSMNVAIRNDSRRSRCHLHRDATNPRHVLSRYGGLHSPRRQARLYLGTAVGLRARGTDVWVRGEASILETTSPTDMWHARTVARCNAARNEEYEEVLDETERFREEIERERRKGKFTFAELEDEESNLERLHKYFARVETRDTFGADGRARATAEVERCAEVLEAFVHEIYEHQGVAEDEESR
jgi:hypothetical protein